VEHFLAQLVGGLVVIFGSAGAAFLTSRGSVRAAETQASVGKATVEAEREDRLIQRLETRVERLHADIEKCEDDKDEKDETIRELIRRLDAEERDNKDNRRRVRALADQVGELRRELADALREISLWRRYAIHLRGTVHDAGRPIPDPPPGITIDA
jgi:predicted RNase H-like nuclease (RuvC/YqgF family)